ncbi:MAG TPA: hypothetical protein VFQ39_14805, partial [Longimicrobium sp.]|nr:hypothetical protein [Longimicrobium sp.]
MRDRALRRALPAAVLAFMAVASAGCRADAQQLRSMTSARQLQGERRVEVNMEYAAGELAVRPLDGGLLYRMDLHYDQRFTPVASYDRASGRLRLGVEGNRRGRDRGVDHQRADIALTREVPLALSLEFGAGEAEVELGGMSLETVDISTGASETRVSFSEPNRIAARAVHLEAGA